jgi:hypothetical protein
LGEKESIMAKDNSAIVKKLAIFVLLIVLATTSSKWWLPFPAEFILVKDNIKKANCIVPLGGGDLYPRFKKAVDLYNEGYSKNIVISVVSS